MLAVPRRVLPVVHLSLLCATGTRLLPPRSPPCSSCARLPSRAMSSAPAHASQKGAPAAPDASAAVPAPKASTPHAAEGQGGAQPQAQRPVRPPQRRYPASAQGGSSTPHANGPSAAAAAAASPAMRVKQPKQAKAQGPGKAASAAASSAPARPSVLQHPSFSSLLLCDIGANLTDGMFSGRYHGGAAKHPADLVQVLERAAQRAVKRVIVTAGSASEAEEVRQLVDTMDTKAKEEGLTFPELYATVGVHPTRSREWNGNEQHQQRYYDSLLQSIMRGLGPDPATAAPAASSAASGSTSSRQLVVAIGECGLDYDRLPFSDKASQLRHFAKHFDLVEKVVELTAGWAGGPVHLPLFLHDRNTDGDFLRIIRENRHRFRHGVVHSFTGSVELLKELLALDLHVGINGCSMKLPENMQCLEHIPLNRLMLETDAPWCDIRPTHASFPLVSTKLETAARPEKWEAGLGVKGRNEPANMVQVLEAVSAHLGLDPVQLAQQVWDNTNEVFFARHALQPSTTAATHRGEPPAATRQ